MRVCVRARVCVGCQVSSPRFHAHATEILLQLDLYIVGFACFGFAGLGVFLSTASTANLFPAHTGECCVRAIFFSGGKRGKGGGLTTP